MSEISQGKIETIETYQDTILQSYIVYGYIDKKTGSVVYVGKDRNGDKARRKIEHEADSHKNKQYANKMLQKDPDRYQYTVIAVCADEQWMMDIEASVIKQFKLLGDCQFNIADETKDRGKEIHGIILKKYKKKK